jgi:DnaK suppressor protein
MNKTPGPTAAPTGRSRRRALRAMLLARERDILTELQRRVRQSPSGASESGLDESEHAEADIQEHIEVALIHMKADTLARVRESLVRLAAGEYGNCAECGEEISERRLQALPFAVRCMFCESSHEQIASSERRLSAPQAYPQGFSNLLGG